jgi:hypothetical protein
MDHVDRTGEKMSRPIFLHVGLDRLPAQKLAEDTGLHSQAERTIC